jgi:hypothetical protein
MSASLKTKKSEFCSNVKKIAGFGERKLIISTNLFYHLLAEKPGGVTLPQWA